MTHKYMVYTHFTKEERFRLQAWIEVGMKLSEMAERLGKEPSSVSRELVRNRRSDGSYHGANAHHRANKRRKEGKRRSKKLIKNPELLEEIILLLKETLSPEQIAGRRKRENKPFVVHETLYQYVYTEAPELKQYLRRKNRHYRRKHGTRAREIARELAKKRWIDDRPQEVNDRRVLGHWEGDTIVGTDKKSALITHVERVSGYGIGSAVDRATAEAVKEATEKLFRRIPKNHRRTETLDNGREFSAHERTERATGMTIYFAHPYHSWERGSNENFNGLMREFFPKGTTFARISKKVVSKAFHVLNHRPRKRLNYLTPHEVFVLGMTP